MALGGFRSKSVELYAVADNFTVFQDVKAELDEEFPDGAWDVIGPADVRKTLAAGTPKDLEQMILAVDSADEGRLKELSETIAQIKRAGLPVILLAKDISPMGMHALMRAGADDFVPYPTPEGELVASIERARNNAAGLGKSDGGGGALKRRGVVLPVYGVSGGCGSTSFAVNLAWELALATRKSPRRVCLLDFDFQYGSVATYLDLPRFEAVFELLSDLSAADAQGFASALTSFSKRMAVLTAPMDSLPFDLVEPDEIKKLVTLATSSYDLVVIDMPRTLTNWTETVLSASESFFVLMESDLRSAQNMLRFLRTLQAEDLPLEKLVHVMNRSPGFTDISGRNRVKRMADSLGVEYTFMLPDGGRAVSQACDHGAPLAEFASGNALRKEIRKVAKSVLDSVEAAQAAIA